jgi:hypothetical protein
VQYYLAGVLIEPVEAGGVSAVATNGHQLLAVTDFEGECESPIIVEFASTLATQMKRKDAGIATISRPEPDSPMLNITLSNGFAGPAQLIDGKYPAWGNVTPDKLADNPYARVFYNPLYLETFCKAEKILRPGSERRGISIINGEEKSCGCILYPHISDTLHARGVIMPLLQKDAGLYAWNPVRPEE